MMSVVVEQKGTAKEEARIELLHCNGDEERGIVRDVGDM